jgi:hypothetical protein
MGGLKRSLARGMVALHLHERVVATCHFGSEHPSQRLAHAHAADQLRRFGRRETIAFFDHKESLVPSFVSKIKVEASLWIAAGAKDLVLLLVCE